MDCRSKSPFLREPVITLSYRNILLFLFFVIIIKTTLCGSLIVLAFHGSQTAFQCITAVTPLRWLCMSGDLRLPCHVGQIIQWNTVYLSCYNMQISQFMFNVKIIQCLLCIYLPVNKSKDSFHRICRKHNVQKPISTKYCTMTLWIIHVRYIQRSYNHINLYNMQSMT